MSTYNPQVLKYFLCWAFSVRREYSFNILDLGLQSFQNTGIITNFGFTLIQISEMYCP
jgi:hypothetical protein